MFKEKILTTKNSNISSILFIIEEGNDAGTTG
jgi:hypothetical protein